jgi:hypothetical protein
MTTEVDPIYADTWPVYVPTRAAETPVQRQRCAFCPGDCYAFACPHMRPPRSNWPVIGLLVAILTLGLLLLWAIGTGLEHLPGLR